MSEELRKKAWEKGYGTLRRHIFLCTGNSCAPQETNKKLWEYLKNQLQKKEPNPEVATVARSKVECLRLCSGGPLAVVYPEGVLYHELNEEKIDAIIEQHLLQGKVLTEFALVNRNLIS